MSSVRMHDGAAHGGARTPPATTRPQPMALLSAIFNCFALNGLIVLACLPVVTIPASLRAGTVALERWRDADDDRVARVFWDTLVATRWRAVTAAVGGPIAAALLAGLEIQYFAGAHTPADAISLGLGACALLICLASIGYALVLSARRPELTPLAVWSTAASLAVRHVGASALLVAELGVLGLLLARDPALTVVCVPLGALALVRSTAGGAIDRAVAAPGERSAGTPNDELSEGGGR